MNIDLPSANNVYSTIEAPVNLFLARNLLMREFPDARISIYTSSYNGAMTLHVDSEDANFEGFPMSDESNPSYFFNGRLSGSDPEVVAKIQSIFQRFESDGFRISIEAYDSDHEIIGQFTTKKNTQGSEL